jgi:hypothetical protein
MVAGRGIVRRVRLGAKSGARTETRFDGFVAATVGATNVRRRRVRNQRHAFVRRVIADSDGVPYDGRFFAKGAHRALSHRRNFCRDRPAEIDFDLRE